MRVLLTGASGLLGSHILEKLLTDGSGFEVHALTRSVSPRVFLSSLSNLETHEGDLLDSASLARLPKFDVVIHSAAFASSLASDEERMRAVNVEGTRNALTLIQGPSQRFIHVSSIATLSNNRGGTVDEANAGSPRDTAYARTKLEAERLVENELEPSQLLLAHPTFMIDRYDSRPSSGSIFIALRLKKLTHYIDAPKNIVAARDVASGIVSAMKGGQHGRFILGGRDIPLHEFFDLACRELRIENSMVQVRKDDANSIPASERPFVTEFCIAETVSSAKAANAFGYRAATDISIAIKDAIDWMEEKRLIRRGRNVA